jgi:hypothetical protein
MKTIERPRLKAILAIVLCIAACGAPALPAPPVGAPPVTQALSAMPLAASDAGRQIMDLAMKDLALDVEFKFLDKTYKNDVYVRDPITGNKVRTACVRFKATSGFRFAIDPPAYQLTSQQGLKVEQNIARLDANGLTVKFQLGPCADIASGYGIKLRDVKLVYKARPMIEVKNNGCNVALNPIPDDTRVSIGDLNIIGVQNDIDKLAKDAVREGLNLTLQNFFNSSLGSGLARAAVQTCGGSKGR